jgi:hypothetical protein
LIVDKTRDQEEGKADGGLRVERFELLLTGVIRLLADIPPLAPFEASLPSRRNAQGLSGGDQGIEWHKLDWTLSSGWVELFSTLNLLKK